MDKIYQRLSKIPIIKHNYSLKFFFVAFIGIHIPLIGIISYILTEPASYFSSKIIIITTLVFTLLSTALTLYILNRLLAPLLLTDKAMKDYMNKGIFPSLPTTYVDEAGKLMSVTQETIHYLNQLVDDKQEITTLVSHNLRAPLNQIIGLCELIKIDSGNLEDYVGKIESITKSQLNQLSDLLTQLMTIGSRINISESKVYNINQLISEEVGNVLNTLQLKKLKLSLNLAEEVLTSDKSKSNLSLVFQNLLSNAIKFSYNGGEINVYTRKVDDKVQIEVRDHGLGFSKSYESNLFKDARSTGRKGTDNEPSVGLGLHLSKKIIEQSGGTLTAFSEGEEKGSRFIITI